MKLQTRHPLICGLLALVLLLTACAKPAAPAAPESAAPAATESAPTAGPAATESAPESAASAAAESAPAEPAGLTISDMLERTSILPGPAKKIVVLTAADCEILFAIGAGEAVIARGEYCNYPPEALSLPELGSGTNTNLEQIIALSPDAVVMDKMDQSAEQMRRLTEAGVPVIVTDANSFAEVYEAIALLGNLTGRGKEAAALSENMRSRLSALAERVPAEGGGSVYFEVSPLEYGLWTAGEGTFMDEICDYLGLNNCFSDVRGWVEISEEQVLQRKPDYIVTSTMYFGEGPTPAEEILSRPAWQQVPAVANSCVSTADSDAITRPGPRLADAAEELYHFVYGG